MELDDLLTGSAGLNNNQTGILSLPFPVLRFCNPLTFDATGLPAWSQSTRLWLSGVPR